MDTPRGRLAGERLANARGIHVPHLAVIETASVIREWALSGQIESTQAWQALRDLSELPAVRHPHEPYLGRVWDLRANLSAYDAVYVALAEVLEAPLLTCDERLARSRQLPVIVELVRRES